MAHAVSRTPGRRHRKARGYGRIMLQLGDIVKADNRLQG